MAGRKKSDGGERKTRRLTIRLNDSEDHLLTRLKIKNGATMTDVVVTSTLAYITMTPDPEPLTEAELTSLDGEGRRNKTMPRVTETDWASFEQAAKRATVDVSTIMRAYSTRHARFIFGEDVQRVTDWSDDTEDR